MIFELKVSTISQSLATGRLEQMTKPNKLNYFKTKAPLNTCHVDEPDVVGLRLMVSHSATKYHHLAAKHHCRVPVPHTRWAVALPPQQVLKKAESVRHGWGERNKEPGKTRQKINTKGNLKQLNTKERKLHVHSFRCCRRMDTSLLGFRKIHLHRVKFFPLCN